MKIGVPKELKSHEYRVALVPYAVKELVEKGHEVYIEKSAGNGAGCADEEYVLAGAYICESGPEIYEKAELIIKVKEPELEECSFLTKNHVLFTYLHLAAAPALAEVLCQIKCTAIAYETITDTAGRLPLLTPMSEIAGRVAVQVGAHLLQKDQGGSGVLLMGAPGISPAHVVILGGGVAGMNAALVASSLWARVTILDRSPERLRVLNDFFQGKVETAYSTPTAVEKYVLEADIVIGAVLIPGGAAPKIVKREWIKRMSPGSCVVDVSIDQGGCFETSELTSLHQPTYKIDEVTHYCVPNIPSLVARTSTFSLNNATLSYILLLANKGIKRALEESPTFYHGLNLHRGKVVHPQLAKDLEERRS